MLDHFVAQHTIFSDFCWKWTKTTVVAANSDVPSSVSFEARDMLAAQGRSAAAR
jgi:hypothetical protein